MNTLLKIGIAILVLLVIGLGVTQYLLLQEVQEVEDRAQATFRILVRVGIVVIDPDTQDAIINPIYLNDENH